MLNHSLIEIILYVSDMEAQVAFYRDQLGLKTVDPPLDSYADEHWVPFDTGSCRLCLHSGGRGRIGEDAPKFVFRVADIQAVRAELIARGVPLGEIRHPAPRLAVCDARDPEDNRFSIESSGTGHTAD